ncbi:MAG: DUF262 domain-containing HNH endonuclease family protein [Pseudomonadota bacterium]
MVTARLDDDLATYLRAEVVSIAMLLGAETTYVLPWAQRSYAWRDESVRRLISDLLRAFRSSDYRYVLGDLKTAGLVTDDRHCVVDGQQRLITLSLILSHLRDLMPPSATRDRVTASLSRMADGTAPDDIRPVLEIQSHLLAVYQVQVLDDVGSDTARDMTLHRLSEPGARIVMNRQVIASTLKEAGIGPADVETFAGFILDRCLVVIQSVDREQEALTLLATKEETALPFEAGDCAKVTLISLIEPDAQGRAGVLWDEAFGLLGAEQFARLLQAIRIQAVGASWDGRGTTPVETDLARQFRFDQAGCDFLEAALGPQADLLDHVLRAQGLSASQDKPPSWDASVVRSLQGLGWLDNDHWLAPALSWLRWRGPDRASAPAFFKQLDRMAWMHRTAGVDPQKSSRAFAALAAEVKEVGEDASTLPIALKYLNVPDSVVAQARENLDSRTFYYKSHSHLVLRRLSRALGRDPGVKDGVGVTGEHVLPRNPKEGSGWLKDFGDMKAVTQYSDRIGNIALLTRAENQRCANRDWPFKRDVCATSNLTLARNAAEYERWTPDTVRERSEKLIEIFFNDF